MIQDFFKEQLEVSFPHLSWSIDYYEENANVGVVYAENSGAPSKADDNIRYPNYMIFIRDADWARAEQTALNVVPLFHKRLKELYTNPNGKEYHIIFIKATTDANRLGVNGQYMEYSINFEVTIREVI